jgi:hypothetical protein
VGDNWARWLKLVRCILDVCLSEQRDSFIRTSFKCFSVKALYKDLMVGGGSHLNLVSWKARNPLKINFFFSIYGRVLS